MQGNIEIINKSTHLANVKPIPLSANLQENPKHQLFFSELSYN